MDPISAKIGSSLTNQLASKQIQGLGSSSGTPSNYQVDGSFSKVLDQQLNAQIQNDNNSANQSMLKGLHQMVSDMQFKGNEMEVIPVEGQDITIDFKTAELSTESATPSGTIFKELLNNVNTQANDMDRMLSQALSGKKLTMSDMFALQAGMSRAGIVVDLATKLGGKVVEGINKFQQMAV